MRKLRLLHSNIIVAKQSSKEIVECIKKIFLIIRQINIFLTKITTSVSMENDFFYYEDKYGSLKIPKPGMSGQFQLENASTAIAS